LLFLSYFPKILEEEENKGLYHEITKEELLVVILLFKKDKSPNMDGWTTKFFKHFLDIVEEYCCGSWRKLIPHVRFWKTLIYI